MLSRVLAPCKRTLFRGFALSQPPVKEVGMPERKYPLITGEYTKNERKITNYNLEENKDFTEKLSKAKTQRNVLAALEKEELKPRRQRRIYDRPRIDTDISQYDCYRSVGEDMLKDCAEMYPVICKFNVPPALVERAFGKGFKSYRNETYSTKEWDFVDVNRDRFLVFDYKCTQEYWGPNLLEEDYIVDFSNQVLERKETEKILVGASTNGCGVLGRFHQFLRIQSQRYRWGRLEEVSDLVHEQDQ